MITSADSGERSTRRVLLGATALLAVVPALLPLMGSLLQNGDAAVYNDQVDRQSFGERTTHIGYVALGVLFRALLPGETDAVMNWMTVILGMVGLFAVYFTAYRVSQSIAGSLLAAVAVLCMPVYLRGMLLSEVDVPLAACTALAFALWIAGRPIAAGLVYGLVMLISPLGALVLPAFLLASPLAPSGEPLRRGLMPELRPLLAFALAGLAVYLPVVLVHYQDYLHGSRGLFSAAREPFDLLAHARRSLVFGQRQLAWLGPVLGFGVLVGVKSGQRALLAGLALCFLTGLVFGERFGMSVPVQLPVLALLAPCLALAVTAGPVPQRALIAAAAVAAIAWNGYEAQRRVRKEMASITRMRTTMLAIREASPLPPTVIGLKGFSDVRRAERWLHGTTSNGLVLARSEFFAQCRDMAFEPEDRAIWFLNRTIKRPCHKLMLRYQMLNLTVRGKDYRVLLPPRLLHNNG